MKKLQLFLLLSLSVLCACGTKESEWAVKCKLADEEAKTFRMTMSEEHFNHAMSLYNDIISNSPDYRNAALVSKAILLRNVNKFSDAMALVEQIPDTAAVFLPYSSKSIFINLTLSEKFELDGDFEMSRHYIKLANEELGLLLEGRKDNIYSAICAPVPAGGYYEDEDISPFLYYLQYTQIYNPEKVKDVIQTWENGVLTPNEYSELFFNGLKARLGIM